MQAELDLRRQFNHKAMRRFVGFTAILVSPVVMVFSQRFGDLTSISISYWTDARDIFVGSLIAIGFFLSAYNGTGLRRDWEYWLSKLAGVFAICIALFPTDGFPGKGSLPAQWVQCVAGLFGLAVETVHFGSAVLLFACLIALMWFFSARAKIKGKHGRAKLYQWVSVLMGGGIAVGYVVGEFVLHIEATIFWIETWGLTLFGIGWLVAGCYRSEDQKQQAPVGHAQSS